MALTLNFRDITPEDTRILRMVALRNGKAEDYLCCDVTNEDGVTQTTWYSKADVALWGEDYIRAHTTMEYSDYTGWIISLDMELWNDAQASPANQEKGASLPQIPTWLEGHVKEQAQKRLPTVTLCSSAGNELLEVWYYGELFTVKGAVSYTHLDVYKRQQPQNEILCSKGLGGTALNKQFVAKWIATSIACHNMLRIK